VVQASIPLLASIPVMQWACSLYVMSWINLHACWKVANALSHFPTYILMLHMTVSLSVRLSIFAPWWFGVVGSICWTGWLVPAGSRQIICSWAFLYCLFVPYLDCCRTVGKWAIKFNWKDVVSNGCQLGLHLPMSGIVGPAVRCLLLADGMQDIWVNLNRLTPGVLEF
jgi:hypothetical protein